MDEFPDVSFYVLSEPALTAPETDEVGVWQELEHLRTENHAWRECIEGILVDVERHRMSTDGLKAAIRQRVVDLGGRVARVYRATGAR